jgi:flagellar basal-body rod protein FlgF
MENSIYVALSQQSALQREIGVVANNIANMNSPGFKSQAPLFLRFIEKIDGQELRDPKLRQMALVNDYGTVTNFQAGPINVTGNPLDVALNGDGFFVLQRGNDRVYTRNGHFQLDPQRRLVTTNGDLVLGQNNQPIQLPENDNDISITNDGTVASRNNVINQLQIVKFDKPQFVEPAGDGLYSTKEQEVPATDTEVKQGYLEGSNVNGIKSMTEMIEIQRAYERANQIVQQEHERIRKAAEKISRS